MALSDSDVLRAARAILPELGRLLGDDAPEVARRLADLLARAETGAPVADEILALLAEREPTRAWVASHLGVGGRTEAEKRATRSFRPPTTNGGGSAREPTAASNSGEPGPVAASTAHALLRGPDVVVAGAEFPLVAGLSPTPTPGVVSERPMQVPAGDYLLTVQVHTEGFTLRPGESWRLQAPVTAGERFPAFTLHLTPDPQDDPVLPRTIQALYSVGGQTVGLAVRSVAVVRSADLVGQATVEPQEPGVDIAVPTAAVAPDLTIQVLADTAAPSRLHVYLNTPHRDLGIPPGPFPIDIGDARAFLRQLVDQVSARESQPGIYEELTGAGYTIADQLPPEVWDALRAVHGRAGGPPSVLILSAEPYVPWELAVIDPPLDPAAPPFLGAQARVGRWVLGKRRPKLPPPAEVEVDDLAVVSGAYGEVPGWADLPEARAEAEAIAASYGAERVEARLPAVLDFLSGTAGLAHFAVHGRYDQTGAQDGLVLVDGQTLTPNQVKGRRLGGSPFVFLNACQVGAGNEVLGDYAGMAAAFLYAGASGVVAPLWSVKDTVAREIALSFYARVFGNPPADPAEVFRTARAAFTNSPATTSATFLAYQFFGHPLMKLRRKE